jgi:amidophosphoribosyltransferase
LSVFIFQEVDDAEIYQERKNLGRLILPAVLNAIEDTDKLFFLIFLILPTSFYGLVSSSRFFEPKKK